MKPYQRYISSCRCTISGDVRAADRGRVTGNGRVDRRVGQRTTAVDGVLLVDTSGSQPTNAVTAAAHHRSTKRLSGRVVQEKVDGKVGVEQILEEVLDDEYRISGFVVGVQLRHDEHVDTDNMTRDVTHQKHNGHHQQCLRHLNKTAK